MFASHGIDAVYLPFRVPAADFAEFVDFAQHAGIAGLSVTAPHKSAAALVAEPGDETSSISEAVNTLVRTDAGFRSYNTDGEAFAAVLRDHVARISGLNVFLIGAGGAARAIAYVLTQAGAVVSICNRDSDRGLAIAQKIGCGYSCQPGDLASADVVINATPVSRREDDTEEFLQQRIPVGALAIP